MSENQAIESKEARRQARRREWRETESRLVARNTTEIVLHTVIGGFMLFGVLSALSLFFGWDTVGNHTFLLQFSSAFLMVLAGRYGEQTLRKIDETETERQGLSLTEGRKAGGGATKL